MNAINLSILPLQSMSLKFSSYVISWHTPTHQEHVSNSLKELSRPLNYNIEASACITSSIASNGTKKNLVDVW